jgi:hypothetical protein
MPTSQLQLSPTTLIATLIAPRHSLFSCFVFLFALYNASLIPKLILRLHSNTYNFIIMATTELPEWENSRTPKKSIFSRANPFNNVSAGASPSFWSAKKSPFSSVAAPTTVSAEAPEKDALSDVPHSEEVKVAPGTRRRYCGRSRNTCIVLFILLICLLGLIIGLAVGLRKGYVNLNTFHPKPF